MAPNQIILLVLLAALTVAGIGWLIVTFSSSRQREIRGLMTTLSASSGGDGAELADGYQKQEIDPNVEEIKRLSGSAKVRRTSNIDLDAKLFRAGIFSAAQRDKYRLVRTVTPVAVPVLLFVVVQFWLGNLQLSILFVLLGVFIGVVAPGAWLDRQVRLRDEEVMYYLPLVIEQISIGVSSALDVGPCISLVVSMANERDSHNPVTEMFSHVEKLIRSGLNLEDALFDVGDVSGMNDVRHAFMFLAQCAKHGGEVSRQLQELADAVTVSRQVQVEARITALPVKATGPLAMVFAGFFIIILAGLFVKLMGAFG